MTDAVWITIAAVLVAIILIAVLGPQLGWFTLNLPGIGMAGGQNKGKASADGSKAGRNITVGTGPGGDASANNSEAANDINVSSGSKR